MSSDAAVVGLTYRSVDVQVVDGLFLEIVRGLAEVVEVRGQDLTVPSRSGQIVRNRVGHRLAIELRGWIRGVDSGDEDDDRAAFAGIRAAFRGLFDPTLEPDDLVASLEDGSQRTIAARTLNILTEIVVPTFVRVSVELESIDPDWSVTGS